MTCPVVQGCEFTFGSDETRPAKKESTAPAAADTPFTTSPLFLNYTNCYRRLARELSRWVVQTMSPNNPKQHVPSDKELQHQARWILYDE